MHEHVNEDPWNELTEDHHTGNLTVNALVKWHHRQQLSLFKFTTTSFEGFRFRTSFLYVQISFSFILFYEGSNTGDRNWSFATKQKGKGRNR